MNGSCLCGTVGWRIEGELSPLAHCHCSMCRKSHGSAFATYMATDPSQLTWERGQRAIARFESSPGFMRAFCRHCGSVVPGLAPDGHAFVPAGGFDQDPGVRPKIHIFVASKAPWHQITDELRCFDAFPGSQTNIQGPPRGSDDDARLGGSCLCATVSYELRGGFSAVRNCHCSRCRKARAAAHATNGSAALDAVRFTRGEDNLESYRLPGAQFFAQAFCRTCGSIMPRVDPERGIAVIPFGSLDDDPKCGPQAHIFVGSMAPWHTISDTLPQFETRPPG